LALGGWQPRIEDWLQPAVAIRPVPLSLSGLLSVNVLALWLVLNLHDIIDEMLLFENTAFNCSILAAGAAH
jgi:hypothetical protein